MCILQWERLTDLKILFELEVYVYFLVHVLKCHYISNIADDTSSDFQGVQHNGPLCACVPSSLYNEVNLSDSCH